MPFEKSFFEKIDIFLTISEIDDFLLILQSFLNDFAYLKYKKTVFPHIKLCKTIPFIYYSI